MRKLLPLIALSLIGAGCATNNKGVTTVFPPGTKIVDGMPINSDAERVELKSEAIQSLPKDKPFSVVLVTQCTMVLAGIFTYPDGRVIMVDEKHHEAFASPKDLVKYAQEAPWHVEIPAECKDKVV